MAVLTDDVVLVSDGGGKVDQVVWLGAVAGRVASIHLVRNPDKLTRVAGRT